MDKMKSRKLWLALVLMVVYIVSAFLGKAEGMMEIYPALAIFYGIFAGTNTVGKFTPKQ